MFRAFELKGDSVSILGWIAFWLGAVVVVVGVFRISRFDKEAAERRLLEAEKAQRETEAMVQRLVYGQGASADPASLGAIRPECPFLWTVTGGNRPK